MHRELEDKLRTIRLLRRIREAEQFRLSAQLKASQRRMNLSEEAGEDASRYLDGEEFDMLLARQGLQAAVRSAMEVAEEQRVIAELSRRNASSYCSTARTCVSPWFNAAADVSWPSLCKVFTMLPSAMAACSAPA